MEIFEPVISVFSFIFDFLQDIINGLMGCIGIIVALIDIIIEITRIIPDPLYTTFLFFVNLYVVIFTYKLIRRG